eukprot:jgi/Astpho2/714/Aster-07966
MMTSQLSARHVTTRPAMTQAPRKTSTACRAAARPESVPQKAAALAAAAAVLLAHPAIAGPLDDLLPDSAPAPPKEKFERDLGEGRKLKVDPSTMQNNSSRVTAGAKGSVSASADARGEPETKRVGGGLPGIAKSAPKESLAAPLTNRGNPSNNGR